MLEVRSRKGDARRTNRDLQHGDSEGVSGKPESQNFGTTSGLQKPEFEVRNQDYRYAFSAVRRNSVRRTGRGAACPPWNSAGRRYSRRRRRRPGCIKTNTSRRTG